MNRSRSIPLPLALVLAGLAPVGLWLAPQDAPVAPKIAIVDLQKLFESDAGLAADMAAINNRGKLDGDLVKMRDEYTALKLECESTLDKTTEKYVRTVAATFAKEEEIDKYRAGIGAFLKYEGQRCNLAAFKRYKDAIAQVASGRGLDVVLRIAVLDAQERSLEVQMQAAEMSMVLYRDPKLDITDDVIQFLKTMK